MASAALAASLAVAATLHLASLRGGQVVDQASLPPAPSLAVVPPTAPLPVRPAYAGAVVDDRTLLARADARNFAGPLLALHQRPALVVWPPASETAVNGSSPPRPKTARQLRDELIPAQEPPAGNRRAPLVWPWTLPSGESI
jgi:hypothetical protein